jgi:hypothetical protein
MKAFEKWQKERSIKTIGYLSINKAFEAGEKNGWKAAFEWMLLCLCLHTDRGNDILQVENWIKQELED